MAQTTHQQRATALVAKFLAANELNVAWLSARARVDPGTAGDFIKGERWPKIGTQGKIEKALGWPAGSIRQIAMGENIDLPMTMPEVQASTDSVGPSPETESTLLYRRPEGLSDEQWEQVVQGSREHLEWLIDRATRER